ncbi:hypothetical protein D3C87_2136150 [compost metagenome]
MAYPSKKRKTPGPNRPEICNPLRDLDINAWRTEEHDGLLSSRTSSVLPSRLRMGQDSGLHYNEGTR